MRKIAIIVDDVVRDLLPLSLLAMELKKKDFNPILVPSRIQFIEISKVKPDVVVINYLRKENEKYVELYKRAGIDIFLLDQEGGAFKSFDFYEKTKITKKISLKNMITGVFNWSQIIHNESISRKWFDERQNILTGHPKYDIYFKPKKNKILSNKNKILLLTSFTFANPRLSSKSDEVLTWSSTGQIETKLKDMQSQQIESFNFYINKIEKIFLKNKSKDFILKVHPFESAKSYHEKFDKYENVLIVQNTHLHSLLDISRVAIHISSTTAIECILSDVIPVNLRFLNNPIDIDIINQISLNCETLEEFMNIFSSLDEISERYSFEDATKNLNKYFGTLDGRSSLRISEYLKSYYGDKKIPDTINYDLIKRHQLEENKLKKIILFLISWSDKLSQFSFYKGSSQVTLWERSIKYFDANIINDFQNDFNLKNIKFLKYKETNSVTTK